MKSGGARPFKHLKTSTAHILFLMWFIDGSFTLFLLPFIIFNDRIWMLELRLLNLNLNYVELRLSKHEGKDP